MCSDFLDFVRVKPFFNMDWFQWVFGRYCEETGVIYIYMDNILKAYELFGRGNIEDWLALKISENHVHELIHKFEPEWTEEQVVCAISAVFGGAN